MSGSDRADASGFEPLDWVGLRIPALPFERYERLAADPHPSPAAEPALDRALAVASPSLWRRARTVAVDGADRDGIDAAVRRYVTRMATRATPFGLCAGVALARWAARTELSLAAEPPVTRSRPDMAWLGSLVGRLEARTEVRRALRLFANPTVELRGGRAWLTERAPDAAAGPGRDVSVRATPPVVDALEACRRPTRSSELCDRLQAAHPTAGRARIEALVDELLAQTFLLTELRVPLTRPDPAREVARRLREAGVDAPEREELENLLEELARWDASAGVAPPAGAETPGGRSPFVAQVDSARTLAGDRINLAVADEVARAAELLYRITPRSRALDDYRDRFLERYGREREVPVLELLHPERGLGPIEPASARPPEDGRTRALADLLTRAARERSLEVELRDRDVEALDGGQPWEEAPASVEVLATVAACSADELDRGLFRVLLSFGQTYPAAGRSLGRFADLFGDDGIAVLRRSAAAEARALPGRLWAELVYAPRGGRAANVAVRCRVREHEIVVTNAPGVPAARAVPLSELVVGVRDGRFTVRWPHAGSEVQVCSGDLLDPRHGPSPCGSLVRLAADRGEIAPFDWGPLAAAPFLPRVTRGRVVLRSARWLVAPAELESDVPIEAWRERRGVPRRVEIADADNRLRLDLDVPQQAAELRRAVAALEPDRRLALLEALPGEDVWLRGPDGRYLGELAVPLVRRAPAPAPPMRPVPVSIPRASRVSPPGAAWTYLKLYCVPAAADELIAGPVRRLAAGAMERGLARDWFFLRYRDPRAHVRLRLRAAGDDQRAPLLAYACREAAGLAEAGVVERLAVDTYEREVERFGGPAGIGLAEEIFAADSRAVAGLLALEQAGELGVDRVALAVAGSDRLLSALGLDQPERLRWCERHPAGRHRSGPEFRDRKADLRQLLAHDDGLTPSARKLLDDRDRAIAGAGAALGALESEGRLTGPVLAMADSFVHLQCIRLLGVEGDAEALVRGLWLRTLLSLARSP